MQHELDALRRAGISFEVDQRALKARELRLKFSHDVEGVTVAGIAVYPDLFPYFRPQVDAEQLGLTHHQNPLGGNVCLLGRGGDVWQPSYTLEWLLTYQMSRVLQAGRPDARPDAIAAEDIQAEPYTAYLPYEDGSAVLIGGEWEIPSDVTWGSLVLGTDAPRLAGTTVRCAVLQVRDPAGRALVEADPHLREAYRHEYAALWARSSLATPERVPTTVDEALGRIPEEARRSWRPLRSTAGVVRLLGVLIPEEVAHRRTGEGWFFVSQIEPSMSRKRKNRKKAEPKYKLTRPIYSGPEDLSIRVPELAPMQSKTVALFGLGTLGAPAALEFARAGTRELRILDGDFVDAGPVVRWPFGLKDVGVAKATIIEQFVGSHYPYCHVVPEVFTLGSTPAPNRKTDQRVLEEMLGGADLVFDATADIGVQKLLAEIAREREIPYIGTVGRPGAWGGIIFRQLPGRAQGCWHCLQSALAEGAIPDAPSAGSPGVQPKGCGDVTFTGTSFDMVTIALDGVRRAIGTLAGPEGGYPDSEWDVVVISLRNDDGSFREPHWQSMALASRPTCDCSGATP